MRDAMICTQCDAIVEKGSVNNNHFEWLEDSECECGGIFEFYTCQDRLIKDGYSKCDTYNTHCNGKYEATGLLCGGSECQYR